jgi:phosphoserine phosphatase
MGGEPDAAGGHVRRKETLLDTLPRRPRLALPVGAVFLALAAACGPVPIAAAALARVAEHRARGERVALLTGATQYIAEPVARATEIADVICSRLEVVDGRFTGKMIPPLCFGVGKVAAAEAWARREGVELAATTFYTDSYTDLPMLARVGRPVAVNPDPRLARAARLRGWEILDWRA